MWIGIVLLPIRNQVWIGINMESQIRIRVGINDAARSTTLQCFDKWRPQKENNNNNNNNNNVYSSSNQLTWF